MRLRSAGTPARSAALALLTLCAGVDPAAALTRGDDGPGVYLKLLDAAPESLTQVVASLDDALRARGWRVVAHVPLTRDTARCAFGGEVVVAYREDRVERLLAGGLHGAYAIPVRFVVWEDENGVGVGATNPLNLNRTIVDEESTVESWADFAADIRAVAEEAFPGRVADTDYGKHREKAHIGKTMGIVAGGRFTEKIETVATVPAAGTDASTVARRVRDVLAGRAAEGEWGTHAVYLLDLPAHGAALVGVTGAKVETDAFRIVKHGGDDAREEMACPGIDHAAAFPIEVLVAQEGEEIRVSLVDEMYRMKMFFEDAGRMAFAKNMGMPGSIEDEIKRKIEAALAPAVDEAGG
jgi:hypothetical protein